MSKSIIDNRQSKMVTAVDGSEIEALKPDLRFDFGPLKPEEAILALILKDHVGAAKAITIEGIAEALWPTGWWFARLDGRLRSEYPYREKLQRKIKAVVAKLKRKHAPFLGVCRSAEDYPPGYYWCQTDTEIVDSLMPYAAQGVSMIENVAKITKQDWLVPELRDRLKTLKGLKLMPEA